MVVTIGLLLLFNTLLANGAEVSSYHAQDCGGDQSGNIQLAVGTCYGMTGGNQKSTLVLNESEDYTVNVYYGNTQCQDTPDDYFNHNTCINLDNDEFSVMVYEGDTRGFPWKPDNFEKIDNFF